jgi:putative membrane protein
LCRTIEIDLRAALGERDLPPPLLPQDYRLS